MTRLSDVLAGTKAEGRAALVGYLPVGYPSVPESLEAMRAMVEEGVDVVEVGFPYTDPVLDGPVIQAAAQHALEGGVHIGHVFDAVRAVADAGAAAVVMSYWNPVLRRGVDRFAGELAEAGGSGMITPDLVPDEAQDWLAAADAHGLDPIFLIAPSSTDERLTMTTSRCRGFVYAASLMGVTGVRGAVGDEAERLVTRARAVTDTPVCVGLGVSTRAQAAQVARFADGVIVGSALVRTLDPSSPFPEALATLRSAVRDLRAGVAEGTRG